MNNITVQLLREPGTEDIPLPGYATPGFAGVDLRAAVDCDVTLDPGEIELIPTGLMAIPEGYEGQIRPRSGLALRNGISMANTPGTIDSDYRGSVQIIMINHGRESFTVKRGDRIAQLVILPVMRAKLVEVEQLPDTSRSEGGFGHTGV